MSGLCVYICTHTHTHTPVYRYRYVLRRPRIPLTCMKICTYVHTHAHTHTHTHTLCIVVLVEENLHDMSHLIVSITHIQPGAQTRMTENHVTHTADESWSTHECTTCVTALSLRHHTHEQLRSGARGGGGL